MSIYTQLEKLVLPHMQSYQDDLQKNDRKQIEENEGVPFLHFSGPLSTHLIMLVDADKYPRAGKKVKYLFGTADREHILNQTKELCKYFLKPSNTPSYPTVIHFDGEKLNIIDHVEALEIAIEYCHRIRVRWEIYGLISGRNK